MYALVQKEFFLLVSIADSVIKLTRYLRYTLTGVIVACTFRLSAFTDVLGLFLGIGEHFLVQLLLLQKMIGNSLVKLANPSIL